MSDGAPSYTIISRSHVNQWNSELNQAESGWKLQVRWQSTGTILPVFVPDAKYTPDYVNRVIVAAGTKDEAIGNLGS